MVQHLLDMRSVVQQALLRGHHPMSRAPQWRAGGPYPSHTHQERVMKTGPGGWLMAVVWFRLRQRLLPLQVLLRLLVLPLLTMLVLLLLMPLSAKVLHPPHHTLMRDIK